ncbi:hypothetical protein B0A53_06544 [Rhodotorula sp. CCFEE 5036]|nr:hypothetical protein B0A53_06544 [Rhodotorula sp. CCFEE 5036]
MHLFAGFANPFAMSAAPSSSTSTVASTSTSSSLSPAPSSASSQSSFASCDSHLQPPFTSVSPDREQECGDDDDDVEGDGEFEQVTPPIRFPPTSATATEPTGVSPVIPSSEGFQSAEDSAAAAAGAAPVRDEVPIAPLSPPQNSFAQAQAAMAANNSSHSQNLIGHVLDASTAHHTCHLEFVSVLGLGAYGVVYLARDIAAQPTPWSTSQAHPQLGNLPLYAVKCLNKVGLDGRQRSFQRREIALHGLASAHPNIVTLHHVIEEETCIYVVLQFCEDGDLFGMITERQRYLGDDEMIRRVFLQIVEAVDFCHQNSIYHRDLKPENILCLDDGERVVLADFGLATHERTSGDFGCGSTFYMSPVSADVPPTPVTPTQRRRTSPRSSPTPSRRSPRSMNRPSPVSSSRRRKTSMDSSSSSSGHSSSLSQPATPTVLNYSHQHPNKVRIAGEDGPETILRSRSAELDAELQLQPSASNSSTLSVGTKAAYTAYYPIWSDDWADACRNQQADYHVELPPPVILPAEMDDHDEYDFPMPPMSTDGAVGYYTRVPATR